MAQAKISISKPHIAKGVTTDGVLFNVNMTAVNVNTPITQADFFPEKVTVRIMLKRAGREITMVNTNLALLGLYSSLLRNQDKWLNGFDLKSHGVAQKANKLRTFKHSFRSALKVESHEELEITVTVPQDGAFSANVDTNVSYIEFKEVPAVGAYEDGISVLNFRTIENGSVGDSYDVPGHCSDLVLINLSENDLEKPICTQLQLSSHFFSRSMNFPEMIANHYHMLGENINERYGSTIPMALGDSTGRVYPWLSPYPQTLYIFRGNKENYLENTRVEFTFNQENVIGSKNFLATQTILTSKQHIQRKINRISKHENETFERLPDKV